MKNFDLNCFEPANCEKVKTGNKEMDYKIRAKRQVAIKMDSLWDYK
jgi:hypothetical protein